MLAVVLVVASAGACSSDGGDTEARTASQSSAWTTAERTFFHEGIAAGPTLFSRDDGSVVEERRYEPFGDPIEAYREVGGVASVGNVDFRREPRNALNKDTDPNTGWSYHGARWMAPQTARWLTPDPPTRAPDPRFLEAPWDLNPYAYVRGNPLLYWDADGRDFQQFMTGVGAGVVEMQLDSSQERIDSVRTAASLAGAAITAMREHRFGDAAAAAMKFYEHVDPGRAAVDTAWGAVTGTIDAFRTFGDDFAAAVFASNDYESGKLALRAAVKAMTIAGTLAEVGGAAAKSAGAARARATTNAAGKAGCTGGTCTGDKCFIGGTLVATARGLVPIEEIVVGDLVLSRDEVTGETTYRRVDKTFLRRTQILESLELESADGTVEHVTTTEEHPFFIEGRGWVPAAELAPGDRIVGAHGEALTVTLAALRNEEADVWNFRVEGFHSYFVGEHGAWVHNGDYGAPKTQKGSLAKPAVEGDPWSPAEVAKRGTAGSHNNGPLAAQAAGFRPTNYRSHGQPVYTDGRRYITPDVDAHNGGAWKMADSVQNLGSKSTRMGTYDRELNRIGD